MNDRQRAIVAASVGALIGGLAGFVLFTERGRQWRRRLEPAIEGLARELVQLRGTVNRAMGVAEQAGRALNDAWGDRVTDRATDAAFDTPPQSRPF